MRYFEPAIAVEELEKRQKDEELVKRINHFLEQFEILCPIPFGKNAFLARHIASARLEDFLFKERCSSLGLNPVFLEYSEDVFVTNNPSKLRLVRIIINNGNGRKGGPRLETIYLVKPHHLNGLNNKPISYIKTYWGESLIEFHHRSRIALGLEGTIVNVSSWLKSIGPAIRYYKYFFAACAVKGVLFESFLSHGFPTLDRFNEEVVIPAYRFVLNEFGVEPLIILHPNCSPEEEIKTLNWYPKEIKDLIKNSDHSNY